MDGAPASRITYDEPVTLPDGTETAARCAGCTRPFVPRSRVHRACSAKCREKLRATTAARIAGNIRRSAASYQRDGAVYRALRRYLVAHDQLTPAMDAAVRAIRGRHDLTLAEGRALLGLPPTRRPCRAPPPSDAPSPVVTPSAPCTTPPAVTAVDPWSLPSPSTEYAGYYLALDVRPRPEPAITLRHTRLLHGAVCHASATPHTVGRGNFALCPTPDGVGWGVVFYDRATAERLRATTHAMHLGDRPVTLAFGGMLIRVRAPAPLAAGAYRVTVETVTPLAMTTQGHRVHVRDPKPSTLAGACARIATILGVEVPMTSLAFAYVDSSSCMTAEFVGGHWQRGTSKAGMVHAIEGRLTVRCNAVAAWLLLCAGTVGLGGCTAIGFGHVRVRIEDLDASTPVAQARSVYTVPMSSLAPRAQERMG